MRSLSPDDLAQMYEEIGQAYMREKAAEGKRLTVADTMRAYDKLDTMEER